MKGSSLYGHGNSSPAKQEDDKPATTGISDASLVAGDAKLMQQKFKHKTPGWAKVASAIADTNIGKGLVSMGKGAARKAVAEKFPKTAKFIAKAKARGEGKEIGGEEFQWADALDN